ncbi:unnamed protein product [Calypogeia fissa]
MVMAMASELFAMQPTNSLHLHRQHHHQLLSTTTLSNRSHLIATRNPLVPKNCHVCRPFEASKQSADSSHFLLHSSSKNETVVCSEPPMTFSHEEFENFLLNMQSTICATAAEADGIGKNFCVDRWQRGDDPSAGYGITRVMEDGDLLEKAAVNVSIVRGHLSESRAKAMSARGRNVGSGAQYFAGALSLVFHSRSPYVPTFRSDVRYFEVEGGGGWFGGGGDLTPSYLFEEDARFFHNYYKGICNEFDPTQKLYSDSKEACDSYFYIPARKEHRGIGGIFFDDMEQVGLPSSSEEEDRTRVFSFVKAVAEGFMPSFLSIAELRRSLPYGDRERQWQLIRRGRYLEFNLLYDRGVRFGLEGGRMESIMVSAPPLIAWRYNATPESDTPEGKLLEVLRKPKAWADT